MKRTILQNALTVIAVLTLAASQAWAGAPLQSPEGIALDAKGNLYVANHAGDQILVYNANYVQQTKKTIKAGVSSPTGVAFDTVGNLFVSNAGFSAAITKYDSRGVWNQSATITNGLSNPLGLTVDALDDVWVTNDNQSITVYSLFGTLLDTRPSPGITCVNSRGPYLVLGFDSAVGQWLPAEVLTDKFGYGFSIYTTRVKATAFDGTGLVYYGQETGDIYLMDPAHSAIGFVLNVSYEPSGMAIDIVRGRIYVASDTGNKIDVFTTSGQLLHTIF